MVCKNCEWITSGPKYEKLYVYNFKLEIRFVNLKSVP